MNNRNAIFTIEDPLNTRLIEQYLNTFWRETGHFVPGSQNAEFFREYGEVSLPFANQPSGSQHRQNQPFAYLFKNSACWLLGYVRFFSRIGFHRYGHSFVLYHHRHPEALRSAGQLAELIVNELGSSTPDNADERKRQSLLVQMLNSESNIRYFIGRHTKSGESLPREAFRTAEQGLLFGHPFHVTSKASQGFSEKDKARYSPELGREFLLHYFAVKPHLLLTGESGSGAPALDPAIESIPGYRLHPCHPWQADYLLVQPRIKALLASGDLLSLGPQGQPVWPTSSVRTVWQPATQSYIKLALNVRITNFIRNNPPEQLRRAIDVSTLVCTHRQSGALAEAYAAGEAMPVAAGLKLLVETRYQTLAVEDQNLQAAFAILFREGHHKAQQPLVTAYLLEENPYTEEIPLLGALRQVAVRFDTQVDDSVITRWWQQYLRVSLLPLLQLYAQLGLSLEAHLQNCMIALRDGWPETFYVRDMEGASVNRESAGPLDRNSPALYNPDTAWFRFKYYVVVNHIGHFIAALARTGLIEETTLWALTIEALRGYSHDSTYQRLVDDLLTSTTLPAKTNMLSSFGQHGENPGWVDIPSPLHAVYREHYAISDRTPCSQGFSLIIDN